jgi:hypothetical protein
VEMAGGRLAGAFQVANALKKYRGAQPGTGTALTDEGWDIAANLAQDVAEEAARLCAHEGAG